MSLDFSLYIDVDTGGEPHRAHLGYYSITHNVVPVWKKAGVYGALYESEGKEAREILETLKNGKVDFIAHLKEYQQLDSPNGWKAAKNAFYFLECVIALCEKYPKATIRVSA